MSLSGCCASLLRHLCWTVQTPLLDRPNLEMSVEGPNRKGSTHSSSPIVTDSNKLETFKGVGQTHTAVAVKLQVSLCTVPPHEGHTVPPHEGHDVESGSGIQAAVNSYKMRKQPFGQNETIKVLPTCVVDCC